MNETQWSRDGYSESNKKKGGKVRKLCAYACMSVCESLEKRGREGESSTEIFIEVGRKTNKGIFETERQSKIKFKKNIEDEKRREENESRMNDINKDSDATNNT